MNRMLSIFVTAVMLLSLAACVDKEPPSDGASALSLPSDTSSMPSPGDIMPLPELPDGANDASSDADTADESSDAQSGVIDAGEEAARISSLQGGASNPAHPAESAPSPSPANKGAAVPLPEPDVPLDTAPNLFSQNGGDSDGDIQVDQEEIALEILRLINKERQAQGVNSLGLEETLSWAARIRAPEAMEDLTHTRPGGDPYYTVFDEVGFAYAGKWHGENVSHMKYSVGAYDSWSAAGKLFERLKENPGHYQNITSVNFDQIGIGVTIVNDGSDVKIAMCQLFASL